MAAVIGCPSWPCLHLTDLCAPGFGHRRLPAGRMAVRPLGGPAGAQTQPQAGSDFKTAMRLLIAAVTLAIVLWLGTCFPVDAAAFSG